VTELWLVRHGQTDWNLERRYQGHSDTPLNVVGLEQARLAAEALAGRSYTAIYSSDLARARVTAEIIGRRLDMVVRIDPRLREVNLGAWEGMVVADIQAQYPAEWEARQTDRLYGHPPGGESVYDVAARIWPAVDDLVARHLDGAVILVSHGLALATLLCRAQSLPLETARDLIPDNAQPRCVIWDAAVRSVA
jgi:broad specificity phosphatase PhoE